MQPGSIHTSRGDETFSQRPHIYTVGARWSRATLSRSSCLKLAHMPDLNTFKRLNQRAHTHHFHIAKHNKLVRAPHTFSLLPRSCTCCTHRSDNYVQKNNDMDSGNFRAVSSANSMEHTRVASSSGRAFSADDSADIEALSFSRRSRPTQNWRFLFRCG